MTPIQTIALMTFMIALAGYPFLLRRAAIRAQPSRIRMLDLAAELSANPRIGEGWKRLVESMLDDAFDARFAALLAAFLPYYAIRRAFGYPPAVACIGDAQGKRDFAEFRHCHYVAVTAANPFFAGVIACELVIARGLGDATQTDALVRVERFLRRPRDFGSLSAIPS